MKILSLFLVLCSFNALADSFEFECTGTDLVYMNSFSMKGMVDTSDNTLSYNVSTREAGYEGAEASREGVVRENANFEVVREVGTDKVIAYRAYSVDKEDQDVYVNIVMDYPGKFNSQIRRADGRLFQSTCKSL